MSAPQLLQANPAIGATAYVNQIYPVDAVSKLVQIPDTKRIAKIVGTPVVGQALLFSATAAGTVESPDTLAFTTIGTDLSTRGAGRSISFSYPVITTGQQISFDDLLYDTSGGGFGNFDTYFILPVTNIIYQGNAWIKIQVPATAATFDLAVSIRMFDPVTSITSIMGASQTRVSAPAVQQLYYAGCAGNCFPVNANSTMIVDLFVNNVTGVLPAMSVVDGGFQIVSGSL